MTASRETRRLSDKIIEASELAERQGRSDFAGSLKLIQQALLVQELFLQERRRSTDLAEPDPTALRH